VVTGGWITRADRARWQLRAARELAAILAGCGDLPLITWTVASGGAVLSGKVNGPAPAGQVRATLAAWREALALEDFREWPGGRGTVRAHASGRRGEVLVRISAAFFEEER
jgi:hypothetical protein